MSVDYVGLINQRVQVVSNLYARRTDIPSHLAQTCTVGDGFMTAIEQATRQVTNVQLRPGAVRESVISN